MVLGGRPALRAPVATVPAPTECRSAMREPKFPTDARIRTTTTMMMFIVDRLPPNALGWSKVNLAALVLAGERAPGPTKEMAAVVSVKKRIGAVSIVHVLIDVPINAHHFRFRPPSRILPPLVLAASLRS